MIPTGSRKPHRKSRNGCGHCKRRKIKCDETKPHCRNCIKHSITCDFPEILARKAASISQSPGGFMDSISTHPSTSSHPPPSVATPGSVSGQTISPHMGVDAIPLLEDETHLALNMVDLELLHNFVTSTCFTISQNQELRTLWRVEVPRLAFQYDFVMRAILAVSAAHMAHWKPDRADFYISRAIAHHKIGLRGPTTILPHVNKDNCSPLYIFSALTAILSLAMPRKPDDILFVGSEGVAEWLFLLRGITSIVQSSRDWILNGSIGAMIHRVNIPGVDPTLQAPYQGQPQPQGPASVDSNGGGGSASHMATPTTTATATTAIEHARPPEHDHLLELRRFIERDLSGSGLHDNIPIYMGAMDELERSYTHVYNLGPADCNLRSIFSWACQVTNDYLMLLSQHTPHALLIFAHYSILLHRLDSFWWVKGWGTHLITRIYHLIEPVYRQWVRWPIEEIGWVPR
ncbi:hypothetical protein MPH_02090 [Macrophomina phaseolina MS6]|uniref:Zn(2)-C6 fungal-type domain-containing protein n=1 Tax=Macrophomina phaseolina (strain MS6) TaxID=1126212 RepID=K2S0T3_MACPH|nr:hypothetical protein MPH_02090 [Macrophomina phaseolina MS6]